MTQVHVVIGKRRSSYSDMGSAIRSIRSRVLVLRATGLLEDEIYELIKAVFFIK